NPAPTGERGCAGEIEAGGSVAGRLAGQVPCLPRRRQRGHRRLDSFHGCRLLVEAGRDRAGKRTRAFLGVDDVECHWGTTVWSMVKLLEKNNFAARDFRLGLALVGRSEWAGLTSKVQEAKSVSAQRAHPVRAKGRAHLKQ